MWKLKGNFTNGDVTARKMQEQDVHVVDRLFFDIDPWLRDRRPVADVFNLDGKRMQRCARVDFLLALLARQLADPGLNDRGSDAAPEGVEPRSCGPVAYVNLDLHDVDLDEEAYAHKDRWARWVKNGKLDSVNTTYVRISARLAPYETLEMRTVRQLKPAAGLASGEPNSGKPNLFL